MAEITWAHLVNGDFADGADWKGGVVPGVADDAILDSSGAPYTVTSSANEEVTSIQTAAPATLSILGGMTFIATDGTGSGANDGSILVSSSILNLGGTFDNVGSITLSYSTGVARLNALGTELTLQGGGNIYFETGGALIDGAGLMNVDNTLSGFVQINVDDLSNGPGGLIIDTGGGESNGIAPDSAVDGAASINNAGTIAASKSAMFAIVSEVVNNTGGTILAEDDSSIDVLYDTISGGSIDTVGSGVVIAGAGVDDGSLETTYIDGLTSTVYINGTLEIENRQQLVVEGALANSGLISVDSAASERAPVGETTYLSIGTAGATLSAGGAITLSDEAHNYINGESAGAALTNVDNTISGAGVIGQGALSIDNETAGVIDASDSVALVLTPGASTIVNAGLLEATGSGGLTIKLTTVNDADGGTISAGTGSHVTLDGVDVEVGVLATTGTGMIKVTGADNTIDGQTTGIEVDGELVVLAGASLTGVGVVILNDKLTSKGDTTLGGALINDGVLEVAGGSIAVSAVVSGTGEALIDGGAISLAGAFSQKVVFDGSGQLILANSQAYAGTVWKFSTSGTTSLDLQDIAFTGATVGYSGSTGGGVLTVTNGAEVAHISLKGDYLGTAFTLSEDTNGGTIVTDRVDTPAVATIAQAIAAFAPAQAASAGVTHAVEHHAPMMLIRPGTATAA